jgi:CRISPR-associated endoribonuclease Cas6
MRLTITFENENSRISLPIHYNYLIQAFIYSHISKNMANFLHQEGYRYQKRKFKLFTFSRLSGDKYWIREGEIEFNRKIVLTISSPIEKFIQEFAETLARRPEVRIAKNKLYVSRIQVHFRPNFKEEHLIKILSPITVYSTLEKKDKGKKTYYYNPWEQEFADLVKKNILKKYQAFYGRKTEQKFSLKPVRVSKKDEKIIKYKKTTIKGWMGLYQIEGNKDLIAFSYQTGLGAKNSQGFGMWEIWER